MAATIPHYSVDDLARFPDDGNRYELLDGVLLVTPAPGPAHQLVAMRIGAILTAALRLSGCAHVFGPGAVSFPPRTQLEPDVLVVPTQGLLGSSWNDVRSYWLAVEVFSPSSRIYDREFKRDAYLALGVREVWLVDIRDRSVEVTRERGVCEVKRDVISWQAPTMEIDVRVELDELFAGVA
ncbi:MAG: Uma2 family endonuclease [bacterium]